MAIDKGRLTWGGVPGSPRVHSRIPPVYASGGSKAAGLSTPQLTARKMARQRGLITVITDFSRPIGAFRRLPRSYSGEGGGGQFASVQSELTSRLAKLLAQAQVDELHQTRVRPDVSTQRLEKAILDERNLYHDKFSFGVGNPAWLNESAPYWRAIEQGTTHFVGRTIYGIWGGSIESMAGGVGEYGPYPTAGSPFTGFGGGTGGRLRPFGVPGTKALYKELRRAGRTQAGRGGGHRDVYRRGVIRRPIGAHFYMQTAWRDFDVRSKSQELITTVIRKFLEPLD